MVHVAPPKEHKKYRHGRVKFFHGQFSCIVGYKAAELLPRCSQNWGMKSPQMFPIAGTRQQRQRGSALRPRREQGWVGSPRYMQCGGTHGAGTGLVRGLKRTAAYASAQHGQLPSGAPVVVCADWEQRMPLSHPWKALPGAQECETDVCCWHFSWTQMRLFVFNTAALKDHTF